MKILPFFVYSVTLTSAFTFLPTNKKTMTNHGMCLGKNNDDKDDPTKVWYAGLANNIQNILTNSPLNEGKKALVRSLAGDYDKSAIQAQLNTYITKNKVLMLSFVK